MTNDTKYLIWRGIAAALVIVELACFVTLIPQVVGAGKMTPKAILLAVIFFVGWVGNMVVYIRYRQAKKVRWENENEQLKVEVETLAAAARIERSKK